MRARIQRAAPAIALVASTLALLATSPARWSVTASATGPTTASPGRALVVEVTATHEPRIEINDATVSYPHEVPCAAPFVAGAPRECLLPPGASFARVTMEGRCATGCNAPPCAPPPGASVSAKTHETDVALDTASSMVSLPLPSHAKGMSGTWVSVGTTGDDFAEVALVVRAHGSPTTIAKLDAHACMPTCTFTIDDALVAGKGTTFDVEAQATGYEACAAAPCAPPRTLVITRVEVSK